jgi:putative ABC transport system permease protein
MPDWAREVRSRLSSLRLSPTREAEIVDELSQHLDDRYRELIAGGASPDEATRLTVADFRSGDVLAKHMAPLRQAQTPPPITPRAPTGHVLADLWHDLRYAWRSLARSPSLTIPVILTLAFAIGSNVAAFSLVNTLVFRPLAVHEPHRLFHITYVNESRASEGGNYSWFEYVRDRTRNVSAAFIAHRRSNMKVIVDGQVEALSGLQVSGDYFSGLGISPQIGRLITPEDERGATPTRVAVLSDSYWARRFARDPGVLGRTIRVDDVPHLVVGVTRREFFGIEVGRRVDVTVPIDGSEYRQGWVSMALVVRLPANVSPSAAAGELTTLIRGFSEAAGGKLRDRLRSQRVALVPLANGLATPGTVRERFTRPAVIVSVMIGMLLLLASTNWAMLLLARASARYREVAVRLALGSTRFRVARQTIVESVSVTTVAAVLGFLVASWGVRYLPGNGLPADLRIESDLRVFLFALALALLTGILFSIAPVWLTRRISAESLRVSGQTQDRHGGRLGRVLVAAQVALSLMVVVAAAFFGATLRNLRGQDMGFSGNGVITFSLDADGTGLEGAPLTALHRRILERLNTIQGVESATLASVSPLSGNEDGKRIVIPGFASQSDTDLIANVNTVGPDYFSTFGIPMLRGRAITRNDTETSPHVALISESAANYYFAGRDPIGNRIEIRGSTTLTPEIIGVLPNVMYDDLREGAERMFYVPFFQRKAEGEYVFALRTAGGHEPFVLREIPPAVNAIAPNMPVLSLTTLARQIDERTANERLLATISGYLGGLALILAGIGIYGIVAYTVARRTAELGLRIALGASHRHVLWYVARGTVAVIVTGVGLGIVLALRASDMLTSILFGLPPGDPRVYATAAAVLFLTGVVAAVPPVLRAFRIDPVVALRYE